MSIEGRCEQCVRGERCRLYWLVLEGLISAARANGEAGS